MTGNKVVYEPWPGAFDDILGTDARGDEDISWEYARKTGDYLGVGTRRREVAYQMRKEGAVYREIGEKLGITLESARRLVVLHGREVEGPQFSGRKENEADR